jgi:hypothetical protein
MDVPGELLGVAFSIDQNGSVSSLKEMSTSFMLRVEIDCIGRVEEVHHARQIAQGRF